MEKDSQKQDIRVDVLRIAPIDKPVDVRNGDAIVVREIFRFSVVRLRNHASHDLLYINLISFISKSTVFKVFLRDLLQLKVIIGSSGLRLLLGICPNTGPSILDKTVNGKQLFLCICCHRLTPLLLPVPAAPSMLQS